MNFKEFLRAEETVVESLGLPEVRRTGRIDILLKNKNPIYVELSDGTKLFFTLDEYRRIKGKPDVGKTMTVVFQRLEQDCGSLPSMIQSCCVN